MNLQVKMCNRVMRRLYVCFLVLVISFSSLWGVNVYGQKFLTRAQRNFTRDSLIKVYKSSGKMSYNQEVKILNDIYDLSDIDSMRFFCAQNVLKLSSAKKDYDVMIDAIKNMLNAEPVAKHDYIALINSVPVSNKQKDVLQYIRYMLNTKIHDQASDKEKSRHLSNEIKAFESARSSDIYQRCGDLLVLCYNLSYYSSGDMYAGYLNKLGELVKSLPNENGVHYISNCYYNVAANYYFNKKDSEAALEADKQLLKIEDELDEYYKSVGRVYRNMDLYRYVSYRRMIVFSDILSRKEIDSLFDKMKVLASRNEEIYDDLYKLPTSRARYYFATGQYDILIPILDSTLKRGLTEKMREEELLTYRILAGEAVGDKNMQDYTLRYIRILHQKQNESLDEKSKELQVVYDFNTVKQQATRRILYISLFAVLALLIAVIIILYYLRKSRRLSSNLKSAMVNLDQARHRAEYTSRMKTLFLQNMNHEIRTPLNSVVGFAEIITDEKYNLSAAERKKYASLITNNSKTLIDMVDDVIDIMDLQAGTAAFDILPVSVNQVCQMAVDNAKSLVNQGVEMRFKDHDTDLIVKTDGKRVSQVLYNFLTNACKFTSQGSIVLDYSVEPNMSVSDYYPLGKEKLTKRDPSTAIQGVIVFSVTDTGRDIPADKSRIIFRRFTKLDKFVSGSGLGLHVCALISDKLHGVVKLDTTYHGGARFLFVHPIK